jgi:putative membrane protein insertion efficiency factor
VGKKSGEKRNFSSAAKFLPACEKILLSFLAKWAEENGESKQMVRWEQIFRRLATLPLVVYDTLSPLKLFIFGFAHCCRFQPTCSQYARECIAKYGCFRSIPIILRRILRCNPWSRGGNDPLP